MTDRQTDNIIYFGTKRVQSVSRVTHLRQGNAAINGATQFMEYNNTYIEVASMDGTHYNHIYLLYNLIKCP